MAIHPATLLGGALALSFISNIASAADIVDTAAAGQFNTLVAAVKAAGLAGALKGPGPFTDIATSNGVIHVIDTVLVPE